MKINVSNQVIILNRLQITADQFLFLVLTHERMDAFLYAYTENNAGFTQESIQDLLDKGYIIKANGSKRDMYIDSYETTDKFKNSVFAVDKYGASEEFWDAFPSFIVIDSKKIPAKSMDKDKFIKLYYDKIGKYPDVHNRVMEALTHAKVNSMICMGLEKWFMSEQWEEILKDKVRMHKQSFPNDKLF